MNSQKLKSIWKYIVFWEIYLNYSVSSLAATTTTHLHKSYLISVLFYSRGPGIQSKTENKHICEIIGLFLMANESVESNKQWLVCGFNGFDQFQVENKRKLHQFEEFHIPFNDENAQPIVSCSWSYLAIAYNCTLQLQGFISKSSAIVKTIQTKYPIKSLAVCEKFCLLLLENKKVYKLLQHIDDRLRELTFQSEQQIACINDTETTKISYIACGNNISVAISSCNAVFSGLTQIHQFPEDICVKQLQCGFEHAVLLTLNGDIYSWGNGLKAQLGQEDLTVEEAPILVNALAGIKITCIAAGGWHSAAISVFGDIYTWGFNSNGQLGIRRIIQNDARTLMEQELYPLPQIIDLPTCQCSHNISETKEITQKCYPLKVMAGGRHTILLMSCGSIYAAGWNFYGQLGFKNNDKTCDIFKCVLKLEDHSHLKDLKIICGNWCTIIYK